MRVYQFRTSENAYTLMPAHERDGAAFDQLSAQPVDLSSWHPIPVKAVDDDFEGSETDFALVWTEPGVSARAAVALQSILQVHGQLLPLECLDGAYYAYNVTTVLPALDEAASTVQRFSTGGIMRVDRWVFIPEVVRHAQVFKIPQFRYAYTFVTDAFLDCVRAAGLSGLDPALLWSHSEPAA